MSRFETIPEEFRSCDKREDLINWLLNVAMPGMARKQIYLDWCNELGCEVLKEDIQCLYPSG